MIFHYRFTSRSPHVSHHVQQAVFPGEPAQRPEEDGSRLALLSPTPNTEESCGGPLRGSPPSHPSPNAAAASSPEDVEEDGGRPHAHPHRLGRTHGGERGTIAGGQSMCSPQISVLLPQ